ncbi:hypothetical protein ACWA2B_08415 [Paenibacillus sp. CMM36]
MEEIIIELPNKELADEVAYQLQLAWNEAESWGGFKMKKQPDPDGYKIEIADRMKKLKNMSKQERREYSDRVAKQIEAEQNKAREQTFSEKNKL